ncbi:MAG: rhodanese-like domain-containing protein [Candidatus Sungbacteria bacterium]|nr:rhodanese-like domain-containing protein [bacterium]MDZ4260312.1 rhodanese-like domain-containing protein [Candidatus Sungbacteria bacterium]
MIFKDLKVTCVGFFFIGLFIGLLASSYFMRTATVSMPADTTVRKINATAFYEDFAKNPDKYELLDVRAIERRFTDYPENSKHISLFALGGDKLAQLSRDKTIVIFCESEISETGAYHILARNGFTDLYIIEGAKGAWENAGLPLLYPARDLQTTAAKIIELQKSLLQQ